jgi:hypothetical protein
MTKLDSGAKALIDRARGGEGPTQRERDRVRSALLARVGVGVALATAATGTAAASTPIAAGAVTLMTATKVVAAIGLVGCLAAGGYVIHRSSPSPPKAGMAVVAKPSAIPPRSAGASEQGLVAKPVNAPPASSSPAPRGPPSSAPRDANKPAMALEGPPAAECPPSRSIEAASLTATAPPAVEIEARALRETLGQLRDGHPDLALASLDDQAQQFPLGALTEERADARIMALCALGRTQEAHTETTRFLAKYPRSLLAGRVSASCGGLGP